MLVIRQQQIEAFAALDAEFEDRAVRILRDVLPEIPVEIPDLEIRSVLRAGALNAAEYGIEGEENVIQYTAFMFLFGFEFDEDPELPWARAILEEDGFTEADKIDLLYQMGEDEERDASSEGDR